MASTRVTGVRRLAAEGVTFARYVRGLPGFIASRPTPEQCRAYARELLARREEHFVRTLEDAVFANPGSPYRPLFAHAGIEPGDAVALVRAEGVEGALARFRDAGVHVDVGEFKGAQPIVRGELEVPTSREAFDNPAGRTVVVGRSGGSRGPAARHRITFGYMAHQVMHTGLLLELRDLGARPYVMWRPPPPAYAGLMSGLMFAALGKPTDRWFSQYPADRRDVGWRQDLYTRATLRGARRAGVPIAAPEHVPLDRADVVARALAEYRARGTPAFVNAPGSSGVRICLAAVEAGLDVSGTLFRFGGEPLTPEKARIVADAGAEVFCNYGMSEVGGVGTGCADAVEVDDVHLNETKLAVVQHERRVGSDGPAVQALLLTTLLPIAPKIMINVDTGDHPVLVERRCKCLLGELGMRRHLHTIRSYEKLTGEGMTFAGRHLLRLLEDVLPARFGGGPSDYQLVEHELDGLLKVDLLVSPGVGRVDEAAVVRTVLDTLAGEAHYLGLMTSLWRDGETLRVVRREPYQTGAAKILPLHVLRR